MFSTLLSGALMLASPPSAALGPPVPTMPARPTLPERAPDATAAQASAVDVSADSAQVLTLTLPEALRLGLERDRAVRISGYQRVEANANATGAYSIYQPRIELGATYNRFESARSGFATGAAGANELREVSVRVEQLLFDTGIGLYGIYRARQDARAAADRELQTAIDSARRIVTDFHETLRSQALERLAEQLVEQARRQVDLATARFDAKQGARLDITRAKVALSNAEVDLTAARNQTHETVARLRKDLLLPPDTPLVASDAFPIPDVELSLDEALQQARVKRPDLAAAAASARARMHALTSARLSRYAQLRITASYEKYLESSRNVDNEYFIGGSLTLPFWDGQAGRSAEVAAEHAYRRAAEQLRLEQEAADLEVEQAYLAWLDATSRLEAAEEAVALAIDSLQQTEDSFRLGVASLLDVNDARTEFARAETNRIQARIDRDQASLLMRLAIGRQPLPEVADEEIAGE